MTLIFGKKDYKDYFMVLEDKYKHLYYQAFLII